MKYVYFVASLCFAISLSSCEKKKDPCPAGYEGAECTSLSKDKMIGLWQGDENCNGTIVNYKYTLESINSPLSFKIKNLNNNPQWEPTATMTSSYTFSFNGSVEIPKATFSGTGVLDSMSGVMIMKYKYKLDGGDDIECQMQSARK